MKASNRNQLEIDEIGPLGPDEQEAALRRSRSLLEVVGDALRRRGGGTWEGAAHLLDAVFGAEGRPVAASVLRASFRNAERNYARLEHLALVIDDPEVQAFLRPPVKSPAEELRELRESMARRAPDALEAFDRSRGGRR